MRLLRANDVADILACSLSQVYSLKDRGMIPFVKIGGMVRFREQDIEDFIHSRVMTPLPPPRRPSRFPQLKHLQL